MFKQGKQAIKEYMTTIMKIIYLTSFLPPTRYIEKIAIKSVNIKFHIPSVTQDTRDFFVKMDTVINKKLMTRTTNGVSGQRDVMMSS